MLHHRPGAFLISITQTVDISHKCTSPGDTFYHPETFSGIKNANHRTTHGATRPQQAGKSVQSLSLGKLIMITSSRLSWILQRKQIDMLTASCKTSLVLSPWLPDALAHSTRGSSSRSPRDFIPGDSPQRKDRTGRTNIWQAGESKDTTSFPFGFVFTLLFLLHWCKTFCSSWLELEK